MDILIAGFGFVGRAHEAVLKERHDVHIYDPALGYNDFWKKPDCAIICVSTPSAEDGSCNIENVIDTISYLDEEVPILIKSTISLEGWRRLNFMFPNHKLAFSPEFLRAATAVEDFKNSRVIYVGGKEELFWHTVFRLAFNDSTFTTQIQDPEVLILAKYFRNSFLASKVAFFNQVYDLCESADVDFTAVADVVGADERIGYSHIRVSKERGYGGHCFPKDISAIIATADKYDVDLSILEEIRRYNNDIRKE